MLVRSVAVRCLRQFDAAPESPGASHAQSQRFLNPAWAGLGGGASKDNDPPLRSCVEQLVGGATVKEMMAALRSPEAQCRFESDGYVFNRKAIESFIRWLAALRLVRVSERNVEGQHARMHRLKLKAPAASVPYLSLELRMTSLQHMMMSRPQAGYLCCCRRYVNYVT